MAGRGASIYFVTGAAGFVGGRFLAAMRQAAPEITLRALVHRRPVRAGPGVEPVTGSLHDEAGLHRLLDGVDTIVHFAAVTHADAPAEYQHVNAAGTATLGTAARRAGVRRFVLISSRAIDPACGAYAASKRQAEVAVRDSGLVTTILRFSEMYGAGSSEGLNALIALVRRSPVVPYPAGPFRLAPLHVDDGVRAATLALARADGEHRTYTIAGPESYGLRQIIEMVARTLGVRRLAVPVPLAALSTLAAVTARLGRPVVKRDQIARLACPKDTSIAAACRDLGWTPRPLREGLRVFLSEN